MRSRVRAVLLLAIGALYVLSVPWYRDSADEPGMLLGLPDWVAVALGCYVAVAVLNSLAWLLTDMPEEAPPPPRGPAARDDTSAEDRDVRGGRA